MPEMLEHPNEPPIRVVVRQLGGPSAVARLCGVSGTTVHNWMKAGGVQQTKHAARIALASGVAVEVLCPVEPLP